MKTWVVLSDIQIPFQDKKVLDLALDFTKDLKPDGVILNGDILDCYAISDFNKDPKRVASSGLEREIRETQQLMKRLSTIPEKWFLGGNHEDRWRRVQWQFPALQGMLKDLPEALEVWDFGFKWKPYGGIVKLGKLYVTHGSLVSKHSGQTARAHYEKYGNSILVGHTHRLGAFYRTNTRGAHAAYENGCLCRLTPEYVQCPDWQHGFSVVHVMDNGFFNVQQVPIIRRKTIIYGSKVHV